MTSGWQIDRVTTIIQLKLLNKAKAFSDRIFRENTSNNPGRDITFGDWKKLMIAHFDKPVEEYQRLFHQARQETHDSVDDFVEKLSNLYSSGFETGNADYTQPVYVDIADEIKTRALLKGLLREITDILWLKINPTTSYKDIVKEAINVEKSLRMRKSYSVDHKINYIDSDLSNQMEKLQINYVDTNQQRTHFRGRNFTRNDHTPSYPNNDNRYRNDSPHQTTRPLQERTRSRSHSQSRTSRSDDRSHTEAQQTRADRHSRTRSNSRSRERSTERQSRQYNERRSSQSPTHKSNPTNYSNKHHYNRSTSRSPTRKLSKNFYTANQPTKRVEFQINNTGAQCYRCHRYGHIARHCRLRTYRN